MDTCQYANACTPHHTLPFTGLDLILVIALAAILVGCGIALRLASRA